MNLKRTDSTALNVFSFMYPSHAFFQSRGQASRAEGSLCETQIVRHNRGQITSTDAHVIIRDRRMKMDWGKSYTNNFFLQNVDDPLREQLATPNEDTKEVVSSVTSSSTRRRACDNK